MASSTVPAFKAALATALRARQALHDVQITYGAPLPAPAREFLWLADVEGEQEPAALGAQRREESYLLTVIANVLREGQNQQAATERAFEIVAELEDELRNDGSLASTVRFAQVAGPFRLEEMSSDTARAAQVTVTVAVRARI